MKKIAICGYSSAAGKYFVEKYKNEFQYVLIGRRRPDIYLDLSDVTSIANPEKLLGCDVIINFAADTNCSTDEEIINLIKANVVGPVFLAQLAVKYNVPRLIHISSISATYNPDDSYYGYYAESKRSADNFLELYCKQNSLSYCILRPSSLFGTDDFAKHQKFLYTLIDKVKNNEDIQIYGKLDAKRNYLHVDTLSEMVYRLIDSYVVGIFDAVNCVNDKVSEIVDALNIYYGGHSKISFLEDKPDIIETNFDSDNTLYDLLSVQRTRGIKGELSEKQK